MCLALVNTHTATVKGNLDRWWWQTKIRQRTTSTLNGLGDMPDNMGLMLEIHQMEATASANQVNQ